MLPHLAFLLTVFLASIQSLVTAISTDENTLPEEFSNNIVFPYVVSNGPSTGKVKYETGPEGMTVGDLVLKEVRGMYIKKGDSWYLTDRTYCSENPSVADLKLGEFMVEMMNNATDGGVVDSPDHYPDEETIQLSTPPTICDATRVYRSVVARVANSDNEGNNEKRGTYCLYPGRKCFPGISSCTMRGNLSPGYCKCADSACATIPSCIDGTC
ncbi:hypothetical protein Cantr_09883 [Candida viswanathii]|uniref:Uncharacterized protein n=1 Tax=Candida viswanathii TaxID=5486 RepID=A0A367YBS6_9ASCO|nr:hypothetical protein Cantr_09883 [Candida viswanathii]